MVGILECGRTAAGAVVAFHIQWEGDLSGREAVLWSMVLSTADGAERVELGYQRTHGVFAAQFVDDPSSGRRRDVGEDADVGEHEITVRFPAEVVGVAVEWPLAQAVIAVDGVAVAERLTHVR